MTTLAKISMIGVSLLKPGGRIKPGSNSFTETSGALCRKPLVACCVTRGDHFNVNKPLQSPVEREDN